MGTQKERKNMERSRIYKCVSRSNRSVLIVRNRNLNRTEPKSNEVKSKQRHTTHHNTQVWRADRAEWAPWAPEPRHSHTYWPNWRAPSNRWPHSDRADQRVPNTRWVSAAPHISSRWAPLALSYDDDDWRRHYCIRTWSNYVPAGNERRAPDWLRAAIARPWASSLWWFPCIRYLSDCHWSVSVCTSPALAVDSPAGCGDSPATVNSDPRRDVICDTWRHNESQWRPLKRPQCRQQTRLEWCAPELCLVAPPRAPPWNRTGPCSAPGFCCRGTALWCDWCHMPRSRSDANAPPSHWNSCANVHSVDSIAPCWDHDRSVLSSSPDCHCSCTRDPTIWHEPYSC